MILFKAKISIFGVLTKRLKLYISDKEMRQIIHYNIFRF